MARCEDFPCCGHELGCCPDFDPDTGKQLNMKCVCGASLPLSSRYSICEGCMKDPDDPDYMESEDYDDIEVPEYDDDGMTDAEADADTLRSAGMGTDEDYGLFDQPEGE